MFVGIFGVQIWCVRLWCIMSWILDCCCRCIGCLVWGRFGFCSVVCFCFALFLPCGVLFSRSRAVVSDLQQSWFSIAIVCRQLAASVWQAKSRDSVFSRGAGLHVLAARFKAQLLPWGRSGASAWCASRAVNSSSRQQKAERAFVARRRFRACECGSGFGGFEIPVFSLVRVLVLAVVRVWAWESVLVALERAFLVDRAARAWECARGLVFAAVCFCVRVWVRISGVRASAEWFWAVGTRAVARVRGADILWVECIHSVFLHVHV
jgi:hypothetical protein